MANSPASDLPPLPLENWLIDAELSQTPNLPLSPARAAATTPFPPTGGVPSASSAAEMSALSADLRSLKEATREADAAAAAAETFA